MIDALLLEAALENLESTYLAVGKGGQDAEIESWEGTQLCRSMLGHPVSNFALVRSLDAAYAARLTRIAEAQAALNAYLLPTPGQAGAAELLARLGWKEAGSLCVLVGGRSGRQNPAELREISTFDERMEMAQFMARQFFARQTSAVRDAIARATARSNLTLVGIGEGRLRAGAMLNQDRRSLGIYNLCVDGPDRRKGYGSAVMEALLQRAERQGLQSTLQCDHRLELWYREWHFQNTGTIRIFSLELKSSLAIMG